MPVLINSSKLTAKIKNLSYYGQELDAAIIAALGEVIREISNNTAFVSQKASEQVGFDPAQFVENIQGFYYLGPHSFGILNTKVMGDIRDIERIRGQHGSIAAIEPLTGLPTHRKISLWHMGTKRFDLFEKVVLGHPAYARDLAIARRRRWQTKTPQWIFIDKGIAGLAPTHFVTAPTTPANVKAKVRYETQIRLKAIFKDPTTGRFTKGPGTYRRSR